jgi:hypothetical protein
MKKTDSSQNSTESTQTPPSLESVAKEMRKKYADSRRKLATDEEINNARDAFYKNGCNW